MDGKFHTRKFFDNFPIAQNLGWVIAFLPPSIPSMPLHHCHNVTQNVRRQETVVTGQVSDYLQGVVCRSIRLPRLMTSDANNWPSAGMSGGRPELTGTQRGSADAGACGSSTLYFVLTLDIPFTVVFHEAAPALTSSSYTGSTTTSRNNRVDESMDLLNQGVHDESQHTSTVNHPTVPVSCGYSDTAKSARRDVTMSRDHTPPEVATVDPRRRRMSEQQRGDVSCNCRLVELGGRSRLYRPRSRSVMCTGKYCSVSGLKPPIDNGADIVRRRRDVITSRDHTPPEAVAPRRRASECSRLELIGGCNRVYRPRSRSAVCASGALRERTDNCADVVTHLRRDLIVSRDDTPPEVVSERSRLELCDRGRLYRPRSRSAVCTGKYCSVSGLRAAITDSDGSRGSNVVVMSSAQDRKSACRPQSACTSITPPRRRSSFNVNNDRHRTTTTLDHRHQQQQLQQQQQQQVQENPRQSETASAKHSDTGRTTKQGGADVTATQSVGPSPPCRFFGFCQQKQQQRQRILAAPASETSRDVTTRTAVDAADDSSSSGVLTSANDDVIFTSRDTSPGSGEGEERRGKGRGRRKRGIVLMSDIDRQSQLRRFLDAVERRSSSASSSLSLTDAQQQQQQQQHGDITYDVSDDDDDDVCETGESRRASAGSVSGFFYLLVALSAAHILVYTAEHEKQSNILLS